MTPSKLPYQKGFHVSWDRLHDDARRLAVMLNGTDLEPAGGWRAILAITRGGLAPAMIVARELDVRTVETISIKSYNKQTQGDIRILKSPDAELMGDGAGVLIVDDLVDSGKTLEVVRQHYPKAHFATVYAK
ncbi:MAG: xanthine phosphoribosyltransferase, partial [Pseudomonadota bacterium]